MILVTGGAGMLGSFIVRELQEQGYDVRVLSRPSSEAEARKLDVEIAIGDLKDTQSLRRASKGVSGIIHSATTFNDYSVDIEATRALVDEWDRGAFVFISSVDVYGKVKGGPITEEYPLNPDSGYGIGKVTSERMLVETAKSRGRSDWGILRPPHIWGPHPRSYERLVDERIKEGLPISLPGKIRAEWSKFGDDWVDTRELAYVAVACLKQPFAEAVNVINSHFIWHDLYEELIRLTGSRSTIKHDDIERIKAEELPRLNGVIGVPSRKEFFAQTWHYSGERVKKLCKGFNPAARRLQETLAEIARFH